MEKVHVQSAQTAQTSETLALVIFLHAALVARIGFVELLVDVCVLPVGLEILNGAVMGHTLKSG